jgi:hypothetical protein
MGEVHYPRFGPVFTRLEYFFDHVLSCEVFLTISLLPISLHGVVLKQKVAFTFADDV